MLCFFVNERILKVAAAYTSEIPKVPHLNLNKIGSNQNLPKTGSFVKKNVMSERGLAKPGSMGNMEQQHLYVDPKNKETAPKTTQRFKIFFIKQQIDFSIQDFSLILKSLKSVSPWLKYVLGQSYIN